MRVVIQRVTKARVSVNNNIVGAINKGYLILVGFKKNDALSDLKYMANKINNLRIFSDDEDKMNLDIKTVNGEILLVSQFTLYGDVIKSNRPSFTDSLGGSEAKILYENFIKGLQDLGLEVKTGVFGAKMEVSLINDGPVTIIIDSKS